MEQKAAVVPTIAIVGAGPVALFAVFQLGLFGFRCHLFDTRGQAGGQCLAFYPDKPIYDVAGFPQIMGEELTQRLMQQIEPYAPIFHYEHAVTRIERHDGFTLWANDKPFKGIDSVVVATGLGAFGDNDQLVRPDPLQGLDVERTRNGITVAPDSFATSQAGIHAIGDACFYPGKLRLLVSGFHEAALMTQAIRKRLKP